MKSFFWLIGKRDNALTVGLTTTDKTWVVLGGMSGWRTDDEIREDYHVGDHIPPPFDITQPGDTLSQQAGLALIVLDRYAHFSAPFTKGDASRMIDVFRRLMMLAKREEQDQERHPQGRSVDGDARMIDGELHYFRSAGVGYDDHGQPLRFPAGVTGIGASYRRDLDAWVLYTMPDFVRFGQIDGYDRPRLDFVVDALRAALPTNDNDASISKAIDAAIQDAIVAGINGWKANDEAKIAAAVATATAAIVRVTANG